MPPFIPAQTDNPTGLHRRYNVTKANGEPVDPKAIYFVLRIDDEGDDPEHLEDCRAAARTYCERVFRRPVNHPRMKMANELYSMICEIEGTED